MKLTKRLFTLLLALLMASACFVGCSGDDNHNDGDDDKNNTSAEIKDDDQNGKDDNTNSIPDIILPHEHTYSNGVCTVCGEAKLSEGLEFTLNEDGESYSLSGKGSCQDAHIVIPATYEGKPVTRVEEAAFTVYYNGEMYFGDGSLTEITIPNSVTSIGDSAFIDCSSLASVTIGNSVTSIGDEAFSRCSSLTSITVDKNNPVYHSAGNCLIETASKTLIRGCNTSIIPADGSVTSIGESAFDKCTSLTSINIPDNVTYIGVFAFSGCSSLTSITIPGSVTSIDNSVFSWCPSLTSINIPDSITSIGRSPFYGCYSLTSINYGGTIEQWKAVDKYIGGGEYGGAWYANAGDYTVHCTDGDIAKKYTVNV